MKETWLITGASGAIGGMCAYRAAQGKHNIAMTYHTNRAACEELAEQLRAFGAEVICVGGDLRQGEDRERIVRTAIDAFGGIDILVNNAGCAGYGLFAQTTDFEIENMIATDLTASMLLCKAVLPYMTARHSGSIVNISSIWGIAGASGEVAYSAAKAGIIGFTKALAKEVAGAGVRVNCVAPGCVDSKMLAHFSPEEKQQIIDGIPLGRMGSALEIADSIAFLARQEFTTGQVFSPNGGSVI